MSGDVADWREVRILLRNLHRLLQTRINVTGLGLSDGIWGPVGVHVENWDSLESVKTGRLTASVRKAISSSDQQRRFHSRISLR